MISTRFIRAVSLAALLFLIPTLGSTLSVQSQAVETNRLMPALFRVELQAARSGWTPALLQSAGDLWYEAGDLTRALPYWESAATSLPDDPLLLRHLAESYLLIQRWPDALDQLERLVIVDESDAWAHYHLGMLRAPFDPRTAAQHLQIAVRVPEYQAVAATLLEIIADGEYDPLIAMPVGFAFAQAELWPFAELAFQHVAHTNPEYAEAYAYVALARDRQGKDGHDWITSALALGQQNDAVRFIQGLHLRERADYDASLDAFVLAVAMNPQNPAYYAELGTAYRLTGDMDNAERWLQVAVDVSNRDPRFQQLLALFYADEEYQLNDGGLALLEDLTAAMPDDMDVQAGFGWALYQAGDPEGALTQLDGVLERAPDHPRSLHYKATIWLETDHLDRAIPLFERVAALESPFQDEARRILEGLRG